MIQPFHVAQHLAGFPQICDDVIRGVQQLQLDTTGQRHQRRLRESGINQVDYRNVCCEIHARMSSEIAYWTSYTKKLSNSSLL